MRVIAGRLGGRQFDAPKGHKTHPMSEKARGALFSALGDITGLTVLDAFAGSGALAIEAISRGAEAATAVESDNKAQQTIESNARNLRISDKLKAIKANVSGWSDNNPDKRFGLVFTAPPYDNLQINAVEKTVRHVDDNGLLVLDWPKNAEPLELKPLKCIEQKSYGDATLFFYRKII